jgi:hypothetical protein
MNAVTDLTAEKATFPVKMRTLLIIDSYGKILGEDLQVERSVIRDCYLYGFAIRGEIVFITVLKG